jgi:hypothetical protein
MKLFISWSGDSSKAVAEALRGWLPCVMNAIKPFMSKHDLSSGSRWALDLAKELSETRIGLICLTPENLSAPWLLFEAGALSKTLDSNTLVCTYLVGLKKPTDVGGPLGQFQATVADKEGTRKLLKDVNEKLEEPLPEENWGTTFEALWPKFQEKLEAAARLEPVEQPPRKESDLLEEILNIVRQLARADSERQSSDSSQARQLYEAYIRALAAQRNEAAHSPTGPTGPAGPKDLAEILDGVGAMSNRLASSSLWSRGASGDRSTQPVTRHKSEPIPKREK